MGLGKVIGWGIAMVVVGGMLFLLVFGLTLEAIFSLATQNPNTPNTLCWVCLVFFVNQLFHELDNLPFWLVQVHEPR